MPQQLRGTTISPIPTTTFYTLDGTANYTCSQARAISLCAYVVRTDTANHIFRFLSEKSQKLFRHAELSTLTMRAIMEPSNKKQEEGLTAMVTIENIRDLEKYLLDRFSDEPTVNVRIVSGGSLGDAVAVEVIPDDPYGCPWVALFGLTFDHHGRVDGVMGTAYDHWDPKNRDSLRWADNYDIYIGWLPACAPDCVFGTNGLNIFMGRVFGSLYHPERTRTRNSLA